MASFAPQIGLSPGKSTIPYRSGGWVEPKRRCKRSGGEIDLLSLLKVPRYAVGNLPLH